MTQLARNEATGGSCAFQHAFDANHLATATKGESIVSKGIDSFRAKSAAGRIIIGADDALERMGTVVGRRRHCFYRRFYPASR